MTTESVPQPNTAHPKEPFALFENTKYFAALDGLRALCVLLVIFNHVKVSYPSWIAGWLGVDVFFVLSGFLITTLILREKQRTGEVSMKAFYTRRFFRIVPVYLFTVVLYGAAVLATSDALRIAQYRAALPWLLSFLQEYRPEAAGNVLGHAWTLGIEEKFYIFWPLLTVLLFPFRGLRILWLPLIAATVLLLPHVYARSYGGLLIGALLAIALSAASARSLVSRLPALPDWILLLLVAVTYRATSLDKEYVLLFSGAVGLLIASLVTRTGWLRTGLEHPALVYIGKRSYAMYLIHVLVVNVVAAALPHVATPNWINVVAMSYLLSLAGAAVIHEWIEKPCIAMGRQLSRKFETEKPHTDKPAIWTPAVSVTTTES